MKTLIILVLLLTYAHTTTLGKAIDDTLSNSTIIKKKLLDYEKKKKRYLLAKTNYYPVLSLDMKHLDENSRDILALDNIKNYKMQTFIAASVYLQSADELIAKVKKIYIDLLEQKEMLDICKENQDKSQKIYNMIKKEYKDKLVSIVILKQAKKSLLISKSNSESQKKILKKYLQKYKLLSKKAIDINRLKSVSFNYHLPLKYEEIYRFIILNRNILVNKNIDVNKYMNSSESKINKNNLSGMISAMNENCTYQVFEKDNNSSSKENSLSKDQYKDKTFVTSSGIIFIFIFIFIKYRQEIVEILKKFASKRKNLMIHHRNITNELLYEKELQVALLNNNKNHLLYDISHELSNPIQEIINLVESLKRSITSSEDKKLISNIEYKSFNLLSSIEDIVNRTELYTEESELGENNFDIFEKIDFIVDIYASRADNKKIEFGVKVEPNLPKLIIGDGIKLTKVLGHLISNAIKFTSYNGTVNLIIEKLYEEEKYVTLKFAVNDSGVGISEKKQKAISRIFKQIDENNYRNFSDNGWGLIISYITIKLMGGKLNIMSQEEKGSEFSFEIIFKKDTSIVDNNIEYPNYKDLSVGIFLPHLAVKREVDRTLASYIKYLGADCHFIYYDELFNSKNCELPDILFVEQKYTKKLNEMKKIISLDTSIILRVTKSTKRTLDIENYTHVHTIIKPIVLTKIIQLFENLDINKKLLLPNKGLNPTLKKSILLRNQVKVQSSIYASIFKKLDYIVTIANDNETFISKFDKYDYAIFDGKCFQELSCSIACMIRKTDTIPILLGARTESSLNCVEIINNGMDIESIKNKLVNAR